MGKRGRPVAVHPEASGARTAVPTSPGAEDIRADELGEGGQNRANPAQQDHTQSSLTGHHGGVPGIHKQVDGHIFESCC